MIATLTLKRTVKGEYIPRYYTMSGTPDQTFNDLITVVKALPVRTYQDAPVASWLVVGAGVDALVEKGYSVKRSKSVRLAAHAFDEKENLFFSDQDTAVHVTVHLEMLRPAGHFSELPALTVTFPVADIERVRGQMQAWPLVTHTVTAASARTMLTRYAAQEAERRAQAIWKEKIGTATITKESFSAAQAALREFFASEQNYTTLVEIIETANTVSVKSEA